MDFLGIGPLELLFIFLIALIVLGPNDMVKAGRTIGRFLRKIVTSPGWMTVQQTSRELRQLPNRLIREAGLEDIKDSLPKAEQIRRELSMDDLQKDMQTWQDDLSDWTTPPPTIAPPELPETTEEPPAAEETKQN